MIMGSPVGLLPLLPCAAPERLLRELAAGVRDDQGAVVLAEERLELRVPEVVEEAAGDGGPCCIGLPHHPAAGERDLHVEAVDLLPCEAEGLEDLEAREFGAEDLQGHAVDAYEPAPLAHRGAREGGLPLPGRDDDLQFRTRPRGSSRSRRPRRRAAWCPGPRRGWARDAARRGPTGRPRRRGGA